MPIRNIDACIEELRGLSHTKYLHVVLENLHVDHTDARWKTRPACVKGLEIIAATHLVFLSLALDCYLYDDEEDAAHEHPQATLLPDDTDDAPPVFDPTQCMDLLWSEDQNYHQGVAESDEEDTSRNDSS